MIILFLKVAISKNLTLFCQNKFMMKKMFEENAIKQLSVFQDIDEKWKKEWVGMPEFVQGKKKTLTDAFLINKFREISKTPEKFLIAKKIAKLLDDFVKGQEHDYEIFNLITKTFEKINDLQVSSFKLKVGRMSDWRA